MREATTKDFVALLGYEWHSSRFGDYCMIFPKDQPDLFLPKDVNELLDFGAAQQALAIPHHVGYAQGWRGKFRDELLREILLSDPHAPYRYRVIGALQNMPAFYETYDLQAGDGMYLAPDKRAKIW